MKRLVKIFAFVVLAVCAAQLLYLFAGRDGADSADMPASRLPVQSSTAEWASSGQSSAGETGQPLELPLDRSQTVDFAADGNSLQDLTVREREDQYRDWLLFAAVAALQPSGSDYNKIFFDLPTSRLGYMRPIGTFEFGETRSRLIGDGKVLALIPSGRNAAERKDFLAHVADEQRKNQGGEFGRLIVVEYQLDTNQRRAMLTRRGDVEYAALFSAEYGYVEKTVKTLEDLRSFMTAADDLTLIRKTPDGLLLGGRRTLSRKYRSIGVEQIATVWQAEQKVQRALADWESRRQRIIDEFDGRWLHRTYKGFYEKQQLEEARDRDLEQVQQRLNRERHDLKLVNGSGFSLDPAIDYAGLKRDFESKLPLLFKLESDSLTEQQTTAVSRALAEENIVPLRKLADAKLNTGSLLTASLLTQMEKRNAYQAARYDGDLQGTEVGMVLFYTDLLAKLWAIDFDESSPRRGSIRGFIDHPTAPRSLIYEAENDELSRARLWFGPSDLGFQVADHRNAVYLARNATRIYSAGLNPLSPGVETETSTFLAAPIDWWNDHYEEVARYEPEYERLNQIMKWSIAIGWLNELNENAKFSFLADVKVDRSNVFPNWVSRHPELRFQQWDDVHFYPAGYKGSTTETLPLLSGPVTEGGVSLATKTTAKRAPIAREVEATVLRSNLDYSAITAENTLKTLGQTVFNFKSSGADRFSVVAQAKPAAKFRATTAQLAHTDIERVVVARADAVHLETRAADVPLGDLDIARSANGFKIGWRAREIDRAHSLTRDLSLSPNPDLTLLNNPTVEVVVKLPGEAEYVVKLNGSPHWVKLAPEEQLSVDIAAGWQMRAASPSDKAVRTMQASVIDEAQLRTVLAKQEHIVLEASNGGKPVFQISPDKAPDGIRIVELDDGGTRISAWVQPPSDSIHLGAQGRSGADTIAIARRLGPDELDAIRDAVANSNIPGSRPVIHLSDASRVRAKLATDLQNREFREVAAKIADDSVIARHVFDERFKLDLKHNAEINKAFGPDEALHDLDRLISIYGKRPELMLRRGIVQIERGNIEAAAENAATRMQHKLNDSQAFFDEVNARFAHARPDERANLYRYAEYADWKQQLAEPAHADALGSIHPMALGEHFEFELRLATMPPAQAVPLTKVEELRGSKPVVYYQDSLTFNQFDWTGSMDQALRQIISGRLGKVVRLERQDIAHFRPSVIWSPDHAIQFKSAQAQSHLSHLPAHGYQNCDPTTEFCPDNRSDREKDQREVYLVVAN